MPRLILVRHGQTAWNAEKRYQGQTDVKLGDIGQQEAAALGGRLATERIDAALSSDLSRTLQTAEAILAHHACALHKEPRLREICMGAWEGLTYEEIRAQDPERLGRWRNDPLEVAPPGGETLAELAQRVEVLLAELVLRSADETLLLVSHGGTLSVLLCLVLGMPLQNRWRLRLDPASVSEVCLYPEGGIVTYLNDRQHLDRSRA